MSSPDKVQSQAALTNHTPDKYTEHAHFVYSSANTSPVLELLNPQPGERIVDLGCGSGQLTEKIRAAVGPTGVVCGVDSSESMLEHARQAGAHLEIQYVKGDIQDYSTLDPSLKGQFDAVFSSATFHWCKSNPGGVVDTIKWLLKPSGRVCFEFGGFGNVVGARAAIHEVLRRRGVDPHAYDPWYFPTAQQYETLLLRHGLQPTHVTLIPRPTPLPTDLVGWLQTFVRNTYFASWDDEEAQKMMEEVAEICRPDAYWCSATPGEGRKPTTEAAYNEGWELMYVRIRGQAFTK